LLILPYNLATPTFDADRFDINQPIRYLSLGRRQDPGKSRPGDLHEFCGINLFEPFETGKPHRFKFIERQIDAFNFV
jgi:hypothetical protein